MFGMLWIDRVRQPVSVSANIQQLRRAFEEKWDNIPQATINIPQATINSLINSM
jgi:DNA-binding winged helix-turn-helix (wHTH) protein